MSVAFWLNIIIDARGISRERAQIYRPQRVSVAAQLVALPSRTGVSMHSGAYGHAVPKGSALGCTTRPTGQRNVPSDTLSMWSPCGGLTPKNVGFVPPFRRVAPHVPPAV
jgi:hypothetical protein